MRLLIDLDGVCADFYSSILTLYNEEFGDTLTHQDITSWDLDSTIFTRATESKLRSYFNLHSFWSMLPVIEGTVESLKYLQSKGHDLKIVTAVTLYSERCCYEKMLWVDRHLPFIGHDNFYATKDKSGVRGDLLFDDGPHNIKDFPALTCVMDAAYNREVRSDFRVNSWESFIKVIEGITV